MASFGHLFITLEPGKTYQAVMGEHEALWRWPVGELVETTVVASAGQTVEFVADQAGHVIVTSAYSTTPGPVPVSTLTKIAGVTLPDPEGLALEAHQVYVETVALSEQDRSIQFQLTNSQGSLRLRGVHLLASPQKG